MGSNPASDKAKNKKEKRKKEKGKRKKGNILSSPPMQLDTIRQCTVAM